MPIYEYQCGVCQHELEKMQKMSDPPLTECPVCGGKALNKKVSAAGFRLGGKGWYETDFKSGKQRNLKESSTKADSGSGGSKPNDSNSKPKKPAKTTNKAD